MSQRLSVSITFQTLAGRVSALEMGGAVTEESVVEALNYTPANKAGDTFDGLVRTNASSDEKIRMSGTDNPYINAFSIDSSQIGYLQWTKGNGVANLVGLHGVSLWAGGSSRLDVNVAGTVVSGAFSCTDLFNLAGSSGEKLRLSGYDSPYIHALNAIGEPQGHLQWSGGGAVLDGEVNVKLAIGGSSKLIASANGIDIPGYVSIGDPQFRLSNGGAVNPMIQFAANDYLAYDRAADAYTFNTGDSAKLTITNNGLSADYVGSSIFAIDPNFYSRLSGGNPRINFDSGDAIFYDRASDGQLHYIGGTQVAYMSSVDFHHTAQISAPIIQIDDQFLSKVDAGNPTIFFDATDGLVYNRAANSYAFNVGGLNIASISSLGDIRGAASIVAPLLGVDTDFGMNLSGGSPTIRFDVNDYLLFDRATNKLSLAIGGLERIGFSATGNITTGGNITAATHAVDGNFAISLVGGGPRVTMDSNDYLAYDRVSNLFNFVIGGTTVWTLSAFSHAFGTQVQAPSFMIPYDPDTHKGGMLATAALSAHQTGQISFFDGGGDEHSRVIGYDNDALFFYSPGSYGFCFQGGMTTISDGLTLNLDDVPTYADNAAAVSGGLAAGRVYRTSTGQLMVRY